MEIVRKLVIGVFAALMVIIFAGGRSYVWPRSASATTTVKVDGAYETSAPMTCTKATLTVDGHTYTGAINNNWERHNRCTVTFDNVPTKKAGTLTIEGRRAGLTTTQGSASMEIGAPTFGGTWNAGTVIMK